MFWGSFFFIDIFTKCNSTLLPVTHDCCTALHSIAHGSYAMPAVSQSVYENFIIVIEF